MPIVFFIKNIVVLYIDFNTLNFSENKITKYKYPKKLNKVPATVNIIIHSFSINMSWEGKDFNKLLSSSTVFIEVKSLILCAIEGSPKK